MPPLLTFGSWIGGDRDGNPNVTPETTAEALELMRTQCLRFLEGRVATLAERLSFSERVTGPAAELEPLLADGAGRFPELAAELEERNPEEPYRRAFSLVRERLRVDAPRRARAATRDPDELLADLRLAERCLLDGPGALAAAGGPARHDPPGRGLRLPLRATGRTRARHAPPRRARPRSSPSLASATTYAELPSERRIELLAREIDDRRPLIPQDLSGFSRRDPGGRTHLPRAARAARRASTAARSRPTSSRGTEGPADLLEVLLLMKEAGLSRAGGRDAMLRIVPLFEADATLAAADRTLADAARAARATARRCARSATTRR